MSVPFSDEDDCAAARAFELMYKTSVGYLVMLQRGAFPHTPGGSWAVNCRGLEGGSESLQPPKTGGKRDTRDC